MEGAFGGADFSGVRLHTGRQATDLSERIQARAFTIGSDVFVSDRAYRRGTASGDRLLGHELAHVVQEGAGTQARRTSIAIRRALDPKRPDTWPTDGIEVTTLGKGFGTVAIFKLSDAGSSIVVKFTRDDPRRAAFAESVLGAAGIQNAQTQAMRIGDPAARVVLDRIKQAAAGGGPVPADVQADIGAIAKAGNALFVATMAWVPGGDVFKVLGAAEAAGASRPSPEQAETLRQERPHLEASGWSRDGATLDLSAVLTDSFIQGLGRLSVADAVVGNADRLAAYTTRDGQLEPRLNEQNFKVIARDHVGAIDNDTVLISMPLLTRIRQLAKKPAPTPDNWAALLVGGTEEHTDPYLATNARDLPTLPSIPTQGVASIFDPAVPPLLYELIIKKIVLAHGDDQAVRAAIPLSRFLAQFAVGVTQALRGIRDRSAALVADAIRIGGDDRGEGLIDPDALRANLAYIEARMAAGDSTTAHQAGVTAAATSAWESTVPQWVLELNGLLAFNPALLEKYPTYEDANPFVKGWRAGVRAVRGGASPGDQTAQNAKDWARSTDRRTLAQVDSAQSQLDAAGAGHRRRTKATWELAHRRLITDIELTTARLTTTRSQIGEWIASIISTRRRMPMLRQLVAPSQWVGRELTGHVLRRYRLVQSEEATSVRVPTVGRNPASAQLAETTRALVGLEAAIARLVPELTRLAKEADAYAGPPVAAGAAIGR